MLTIVLGGAILMALVINHQYIMENYTGGGPKSPTKVRDEREAINEGLEEMSNFNLDGLDHEIAYMTRQELLRLPVEKMYPKKSVSWEAVRNIANSLTNQLYIARNGSEKLDLSLAYVSNKSFGGRNVKAISSSGEFGVDDFTWTAYKEDDLEGLNFVSGSSGSRLVAEKKNGCWEIQYIPPEDKNGEDITTNGYGTKIDRFYQGAYFNLYVLGNDVANVNEEYVNHE